MATTSKKVNPMDSERAARNVVAVVAKRCDAIHSPLVTNEVKAAILLAAVINPTTIRGGTTEWLLALHRAVEDFIHEG